MSWLTNYRRVVLGVVLGTTLTWSPAILAQAMPDRAATPSEAALQMGRRAEAKLAAGDTTEALRLYESAVNADPSNQDIRRGLLLAKNKAGLITDAEKAQLTTLQAIQQTQVDLLMSQLRLTLLNARLALDTNQPQQAADLAQAGLNAVAGAPKDVDVAQYRKGFEKIQAEARRAGAKPAAGGTTAQVAASDPPDANPKSPAQTLKSDPPAANAQRATLAPLPAGATPDSERNRLAAEWKNSMAPIGAVESGGTAIIDTKAILAADDVRYRFEGNLEVANNNANAWQLTDVRASMVSGPGLVSYPAGGTPNAPARAQYADGAVLRSPGFVGADGQTYYTVVYDVSDLYYEAPWFPAPYFSSLRDGYQADANMDALRWRSQIFYGNASDLAQGIPLLAAFGGVSDQFAPPMPSRSGDQLLTVLQQIVAPQQAPAPPAPAVMPGQPPVANPPAPAPAPAQPPASVPGN